MMFATDDDMVECPYNNSHRMLRKRLQSHLLKCRLHHPNVELQKCPFNTTHLIPEPEFTHHVTNCPDRKLITQYKYDAPEPEEEEPPKHAPIESEENWDETDVADYDPAKYVEKASVIRRPDAPTPSERKEFIKKERIRLGDVDSDEEEASINGRNTSPLRRRSRSPINRRHFPRERSPTQPYRNPSPVRRRSRSPINRLTSSRERSPASHFRNSSPRRRRSSDERRTYDSDKSSYSRNSDRRDKTRYRNNVPYYRRPSNEGRAYRSDSDPYYNSQSGSSNPFRSKNTSRDSDTLARESRNTVAGYENHGVNQDPRSYYTTNYKPTN